MTVCRALPLVALIVAMPFGAGAQFGGMPGLPGGSPGGVPGVGGFGAPPAPPPACQQLLTLRDEVLKHGKAIQKANQLRAPVHEACRLFRSYLSAEAKFIRGLEDNGRTCGAPADAIKLAREGHDKTGQVGRQVCDMAARFPWPASPIPWGDLLMDAQKPRTGLRPMRRDPWDALRESSQKQDQSGGDEDNCIDCGKTGDFWWTVPPPGRR